VCNDCIKEEKLVHLENLTLDMSREIQEVEQGKTCKYLKTEKSGNIQYQQMKEIKKEERRKERKKYDRT
jgi:nicotinate-nucleotide pyrophosphorylase